MADLLLICENEECREVDFKKMAPQEFCITFGREFFCKECNTKMKQVLINDILREHLFEWKYTSRITYTLWEKIKFFLEKLKGDIEYKLHLIRVRYWYNPLFYCCGKRNRFQRFMMKLYGYKE